MFSSLVQTLCTHNSLIDDHHKSFYFLKSFEETLVDLKGVLISIKNELVKILKESIQPPFLDSQPDPTV